MGKKSTRKKQQQQQARLNRPQVDQVGHVSVAQVPTHMPIRVTGLELGEQFVRRDILRTLLLVGITAVLLVGLVILDARTERIGNWASSLARTLHLQ